MNEVAKTPWHLWVVGVISLLWNSGGIISYLTTKLGYLDGMDFPPAQLEYFYGFPAWASAFWALGVWGCFLGSLLLLLRSKWATTLFGVSIIGLFGTTYYERFVGDLPVSMQTTGHTLFAVAIWVITLGLFIYASRMKRAGVLR